MHFLPPTYHDLNWSNLASICRERGIPTNAGRYRASLLDLQDRLRADDRARLPPSPAKRRVPETPLPWNLSGADLRDADLRGVDLRYRNFWQAYMVGALVDEGVIVAFDAGHQTYPWHAMRLDTGEVIVQIGFDKAPLAVWRERGWVGAVYEIAIADAEKLLVASSP